MPPRIARSVALRAMVVGAAGLLAAACGGTASSDDGAIVTVDGLDLGTAGPDSDRSLPALEPIETVAMVGDSITLMSTDELRAGLTSLGLDVVAVDAQVGRRMTIGDGGQPHPGTDVVAFVVAQDEPDLFVIALGTNDVGQYADAQSIAEQVEAVLAEIPAGTPVVWIDTWHRDRPEECDLMNDVIRTIVGRRQRSAVVDWYSLGDDDGVITQDGVHPTEDGIERFAVTVTDGVRALLDSL